MTTKQKHSIEVKLVDGKTHEEIIAELGLTGMYASSLTATMYSNGVLNEQVCAGNAIGVVSRIARNAANNDLNELERMLAAQAVALDAVFNNMARRASLNLGTHLSASETYLRLAFKAQSQCRTTVETLAEIKNPKTVSFVRQANIAGGHQQVNNAATGHAAGETINQSNKLLEKQHGEWLDFGAQTKDVGANPAMATVAKVDGATNRKRKGQRIP